MMTVEKKLEAKLYLTIKKLGGLAIKLYSISFLGLPDRMVLMPRGKVYFAELKSTGIKPTKRQLYVHDLLRRLGFEVYVIENEEQLSAFISRISGYPDDSCLC